MAFRGLAIELMLLISLNTLSLELLDGAFG